MERRRDNKGRILHDGEMQIKDGRYRFKYTSWDGKSKVVYSWRLNHNDRAPVGKKRTESLREMEKRIQADSFDHIVTNGGELTVCELVNRYVETRVGVKLSTKMGYRTGFLYFDKNGSIMYSLHWDHYFKHIREKYNKIYKVQMPFVSPHICRHTYCSKMARSGMNPKTLQYLMGHSDISVTLNTYTHIGFEDAQKEIRMLKIV